MKYYHIDASPFGTRVKLCFDQEGVDLILKDHDIDFTVDAFDMGIAETHYISDGRDGLVLVIIDLDKCDHDLHFRCGVIAHESYHTVCRIFQHIGQPLYDVGEEIFAYTIEHMVKQMSVAVGKELDVREKRRGATKQTRKGKRRPELQVDQLGDGGAGSNSHTELASSLCRAKNEHRGAFSEAELGFLTDCITRLSGDSDTNVSGN
jgi:hypothetical protein